ncbi:hypothetical protein [Nocardia sp. NBC_01327]|uniref:hypothetical protein n=1 Tax=Nocardia sp. NBC_01327 TaxID=2903593 RepID=UPI002E0E16BA|nr:hypothetical protein OG326_30900 [Nocardia sp. NBC_01327]
MKSAILLLVGMSALIVSCSSQSTTATTATTALPPPSAASSAPAAGNPAPGDGTFSTTTCRQWLDVFKFAKQRAAGDSTWTPERELADRLAELKKTSQYTLLPPAMQDAMTTGISKAATGTCD